MTASRPQNARTEAPHELLVLFCEGRPDAGQDAGDPSARGACKCGIVMWGRPLVRRPAS